MVVWLSGCVGLGVGTFVVVAACVWGVGLLKFFCILSCFRFLTCVCFGFVIVSKCRY